jgi:hypothetical protein
MGSRFPRKKGRRLPDANMTGLRIVACFLFVFLSVSCVDGKKPLPGDHITCMAENVSFRMIFAPKAEFPVGEDDEKKATVASPFYIEETEVTNLLVCRVLQWALEQDKFSKDTNAHNRIDKTAVKYGGNRLINPDNPLCAIKYEDGRFFIVKGFEMYPAVAISWYGAIMCCNWLTEMTDGNKRNIRFPAR